MGVRKHFFLYLKKSSSSGFECQEIRFDYGGTIHRANAMGGLVSFFFFFLVIRDFPPIFLKVFYTSLAQIHPFHRGHRKKEVVVAFLQQEKEDFDFVCF